jgi:CubicO group peptidase (beta-lactamase class C family)
MLRPLLVFCALVAAAPAVRSQETSKPDILNARIDSFVSQRVAVDAFSGAILVARNGEPVYQRAAGVANRETGAPVALDTKLTIASTTKLFTNIAIRQLEQAGKLSLADTVGKFLPDYPNAKVRSKVTIEQLLRHRSGIGSFWNDKFMQRRADVRTVRDYMELFQDDSLLFEPGTGEAYSNGGYVLLGAIIERVSGQSYHGYLRDHVFRTAGMTQTVPQDRRVSLTNAAVGYTRMPAGPVSGDQRLAGAASRPGYESPGANAQRKQPGDSSVTPAGGMRMRILGADGRELAPEEARAAMAQRAATGGPRRPNTSSQAGVSSPAGDHYSTVGDFLKLATALTSYRLLDSTHTTALLGARYATGDDFRANGGGPGVNAEFSIFPSGEVVVVLSNYDPPAATDVAQFIRSLIAPAGSR